MTRSERPTVGGIILAAGESSRFGNENKLLSPLDGTPVIRRVAGVALESPLGEVVTVLGHDAGAVAEALGGLPISTTYNADYTAGQSTSLRCGVDVGRRSGWDATVVLLGDMPFVNPTTVERLVETYLSGAGSVVAPQCDGRRGNPVLFDRSLYERLCSVSGDRGARELVGAHPGTVRVPTNDRGVLRDVDTPRDL